MMIVLIIVAVTAIIAYKYSEEGFGSQYNVELSQEGRRETGGFPGTWNQTGSWKAFDVCNNKNLSHLRVGDKPWCSNPRVYNAGCENSIKKQRNTNACDDFWC